MSFTRSLQQWPGVLVRALSSLDQSKLMAAPILFVAFLAVLDRAVHEAASAYGAETAPRITRLSSLSPPDTDRWSAERSSTA